MSASLSSAAPALARFPCQSGGMHSAALPCTGICRLLPRLLSAKQGARGRCKRLTTCIVRRPMYLEKKHSLSTMAGLILCRGLSGQHRADCRRFCLSCPLQQHAPRLSPWSTLYAFDHASKKTDGTGLNGRNYCKKHMRAHEKL